MLKYCLIFTFTVCACVACQYNSLPECPDHSYEERAYASVEQFECTRTELGNENEVHWSEDDRITIFNFRSFNDEYILKDGYEGLVDGEFELIPSMIDDMQQISSLSHCVSFYPYLTRLNCSETDDGYLLEGFEVPSVQNWTQSSFEQGTFPMVAVSSSKNLSFQNVCGILKLQFKGTRAIRQLSLEGHNDEVLAGKSIICAFTDGRHPEISFQDDERRMVTLDCEDGVKLDPVSATEFLFVLPPTDFAGGFTLQIVCDGGDVLELSTTKKNPVLRSTILCMPEIDLDALETEEKNEIIIFEDPAVEAAFVECYDANEDGALSVGEAEAVKSIEAFFLRDYATQVTSLNDLAYFTALTNICDDAFNGCEVLESVILPKSVKHIGPRAFADCDALSEVDMNEGLESIGGEAFRSCYNLFEIRIPNSVKTIAEGAFKDCINMERFYGSAVSSDGRTLICDDVLIAYAFSGQTKFSYQLPSEVRRIGDGAFYNSRNLISIDINGNVESVGAEAFFGCGLLTTVNMESGLETIGDRAFSRCFAIREISLPETLTHIGYLTFEDVNKLKTLYVNSLAPPEIDRALFEAVPDGLEIYVPYQSLTRYLSAEGWSELRYYIQGCGNDEGNDDDIQDGAVSVLQEASRGNGINIVLMGDAFSKVDIEDGTYQEYMEQAVNAFFSTEPYTTYRDLFNVYSVNVVSTRSGYAYGTGKLETFFGEETHVGGNDEIVMEYAMKVLSEDEMDDALIIVLMNRKYYAGTCYMYYPSDGDYGRGMSISYFPLGTDDEMFEQLLLHEAGGHGFAKLDDEYYYEGTIPSNEIINHQWICKYGWAKNVDITSNWNKVKWNKFLSDERYSNEGLGVFEGASTYRYGVYRPTYDSIMNHNQGGFNAPSREAIWYRMHKLAFGTFWQYDYEEFVEYDMVNLAKMNSDVYQTRLVGVQLPPLNPPVIRTCTWREFLDKNPTEL